MDPAGLDSLLRALRCCSSLSKLDVASNQMGAAGAAAVAVHLPHLRALTDLSLHCTLHSMARWVLTAPFSHVLSLPTARAGGCVRASQRPWRSRRRSDRGRPAGLHVPGVGSLALQAGGRRRHSHCRRASVVPADLSTHPGGQPAGRCRGRPPCGYAAGVPSHTRVEHPVCVAARMVASYGRGELTAADASLCPRREPLGASRRRQLGRVSWPSVQTEDVDDGPYVARQPQRVATAACLTPWCVCVCEGNNIGDDGAIALSKVLPKNRSLKDVDLAGTGGSCCCYRSLL